MIQNYLEGLVKEAQVKEEHSALASLSVGDLAKVAGIKLGMRKCSECGGEMIKQGAMYKCSSCGMTKHAQPRGVRTGAGEGQGIPGGLRREQNTLSCPSGGPGEGKGRGRGKGIPRELVRNASKVKEVQDPGKPGAETPPPEVLKTAAKNFEKLSAPVRATLELFYELDGDPEKVAQVMLDRGLDEDTAAALLKEAWAPWNVLKAGLGHAGKVLKGTAPGGAKGVGAAARAAGGSTAQAGRMAGQQLGKHLGRVGETYRTARGHGAGVLRAAGRTIKEHPGTAAAAAVPLAAGAGYGVSKMGAAEGAQILEVGDAAGRLLAKSAAETGAPERTIHGVPVSELQESAEEARGREDIPGRASRWRAGGAAMGGLGLGAAGAGLGALAQRALGGKGRLIGGIGSLVGGFVGGTGGALLGSHLGGAHGKQEAEADVLLQKLRAQKALRAGHGAGMQSGFQMGAQRGFRAGGMVGYRAGLARSQAMQGPSGPPGRMQAPEAPKNPPRGR